MDVDKSSDKADVMTIHKDISVTEPANAADWLQCDLLLCSLFIQNNQSDNSVRSANHIILSPQVKTLQGLETISCNICTTLDSHPVDDTELDACLSLLLQQLHQSYLCCRGHLDDAKSAMVTTRPVLFRSTAETSQRLLAFSQQLSENILNEAVQLSTHQAPNSLHDVHIHSGVVTSELEVATSTCCSEQSSQPAHSTSVSSCRSEASFFNIPVEVEFGGEQPTPCPHVDHCPVLNGIGPFKKIVLVEEVDHSDEKTEAQFQPHHVQQECIMEELQRELSSSENSPSTPQDESSDDCIQLFTDQLINGIMHCSGSSAAHNGKISSHNSLANAVIDCDNGMSSSHDEMTLKHNGMTVDHSKAIVGKDGSPVGQDKTNSDSLDSLSNVIHLQSTLDTRPLDKQHESGLTINNGDADHIGVEILRDDVESLVDRLIQEAFTSGFTELETIFNNNVDAQSSYAPEMLEAISQYADDLVADAFSSAMYKIREYFNHRACCQHCKDSGSNMVMYMSDKALDREWNAQLTAFVDDFVLNIMEEALFIKKTRNSDSHMKADTREKRRSSSDCTMRNSVNASTDGTVDECLHSAADVDVPYFEAEFNVDLRSSGDGQRHGSNCSLGRHFLRAAYSSGSSRRGSCDDDIGQPTCRRSSAGFRDVVLSEFEDELIHSDISTPSLGMFDDKELKAKRRASEPLRFNSVVLQPKDKKRAQSVDSGASRRVILQWLDNQGSTSSSMYSTMSRKRTSSSHLDWFAQDLLVEAFNDAFILLFGPNYEGLDEGQDANSLADYAEVLTDCILRESIEEVTTHKWSVRFPGHSQCRLTNEVCSSMSDSQDEYMDALDVPLAELESVAQDFSTRILEEALDIVRTEIMSKRQKIQNMMTQNLQLSALIQWAAVTRVGAQHVVFDTMAEPELEQLPLVVDCLRRHNYSIADLMHLILTYIEEQLDGSTTEPLYCYILQRLQTS
ncbi:hypothetical protein LSH36_825g03004 [Paralvinella palmiformis]|uniref:Uncharacterized protein n=1 Tax=Paralvinella palmiformis TaxID=53620 RepID=A0AAD9IZ91_9ANNE|nr:hypothetical protein LSH36_825g03004 [Paralvinella palmiformis]